jgi:hypothetical protein
MRGETWNRPGPVNRGTSVTGNRSSHARRAVLLGGALLVAAFLSACAPDRPETSSTPSATAAPSVTSSPDSLRNRLATALRTTSPANASLVEKPQTTLAPVTAEWLRDWQIIDVQNSAPPHPRRFYAALSSDGRAEVLSGKPEAFSAMLVGAGARVDSAEVASNIGEVFLDSTRDFRVFSYRVDRVEDIRWRPRLTSADEAARDEVLRTYRSQVKPAQTVQAGEGWQVTVWMVHGKDLVRHKVTIASDAAVTDETEKVVTDLPVPASV